MANDLRARLAAALTPHTHNGHLVDAELDDVIDAAYRAIWPDKPEPPGQRLAQILAAKNITQAAFSRALGVSTKHMCQLVSGKATLSHGMAIRLEAATGVPAWEWNLAESTWQDYLLRQQLREAAS